MPFRQDRSPVEKLGLGSRPRLPASAPGLGGRRPASAKWGGLLFGYFLWATQEKVTRLPQEGESSSTHPAKELGA